MVAMRSLALTLLVLVGLTLSRSSAAFCGFYVSGADTKLVNRATQVVLMRSGTKTVLSMQNAYEGPPQDFAMVVPVPVVLQKEQVKTLPRELLDRVDQLGSPRLVEYWEQDPCDVSVPSGVGGVGQGFGSGYGRLGGSHKSKEPQVKIEAEFTVGEYEVVILSATDSTALDRWLKDNNYKIPDGAEPYLRPYVQAGSKFFVAKVDIEKVKIENGRALLSPLRFHYDAETFSLPIRLGLINAGDAQDLIVNILSTKQRYEAANYPNVTIPTNLDVTNETRASFGSFYAALLDETLRQKPGAAVTEYAWDAGTCDPCPGPTLTVNDVATLGGDVLPNDDGKEPPPQSSGNAGASIRLGTSKVAGRLPPEVIQRTFRQNLGKMRACYEGGLRGNPNLSGQINVKLVIGKDGSSKVTDASSSDMGDKGVVACVGKAASGLSFPPPEGGVVTVTQTLTFTPFVPRARATGIVLTRLHMRYSKEALGEDLVFKAAPAIIGGRENRSQGGALEQGAVLSEVNNFQARYAIRHPWTGPIACDKPVRGIWGGPPEGLAPGAQPARDLAFARRGAALGTFLAAALPPVSGPTAAPSGDPSAPVTPPPAASSAAPPAASSAAPASQGGGCGCHTSSETGSLGGVFATGLLGWLLLRRRQSHRK